MNWRKWNNILHRDLGYLCFGLTVIYAVSGVAVNHIADWNPSYAVETVETNIGPVATPEGVTDAVVAGILARLGETETHTGSFRPDPETLQIFIEKRAVTVNLRSGAVRHERAEGRPVLREMNFLHLNHPKKLWTWVADIYAVALGLLALTGLFVIRGKKGISGRGAWLTAAGFAVPLVFLLLYL
ncbi:MAG: hypothetical protein C0617_04825 [Desulfuromonas sp.]|uniref:PepSY-associated TM helix domain-containing protein n=1 Tax=Desulfuromonas sp. TaxID=892 RepID=UPI000CB8B07C|nr:PepSY-associated TM helix domain-containing protein [Desulfuromonas sp.]PLX85394.1 MAG: hypothetical protein C0617_04825 [Desulfuromonas sp.]